MVGATGVGGNIVAIRVLHVAVAREDLIRDWVYWAMHWIGSPNMVVVLVRIEQRYTTMAIILYILKWLFLMDTLSTNLKWNWWRDL